MNKGYRTWRLAIAFFGGVGVGLLISDGLAVGVQNAGWSLAFWPCVHVTVVAAAAYWPALERAVRRIIPAGRCPDRSLTLTAYVIGVAVYALSAWASLAARHDAILPGVVE